MQRRTSIANDQRHLLGVPTTENREPTTDSGVSLDVMAPTADKPRWYLIPVRILLVTFIVTLLSFAVSLLLGIFGIILAAWARGAHPNMTLAYRAVAFPVAAVAGTVVVLSSTIVEVRHYRQAKALGQIADQMHSSQA